LAQRAVLNILEDFAAEKEDLQRVQRATLNIFDDFDAEKSRMADTQRAALNILEDSAVEKSQLETVQRAALNILDDFSAERDRFRIIQRAVLNILDDFDQEKAKVQRANAQLHQEITDRQRAEEETHRANKELLAANKELEAFSYSVSHDLRAPLRSIDGFSQALLEDHADQLDSSARDHLQRVRSAAQRMSTLIDDLLNLSRVTRTPLRREAVNLSALAASVADDLRQSDPLRRVSFLIEEGLAAEGDARLLRVAMENLLGNSWKYSSAHESARIEFGCQKRDGRSVYFVRDDGAGFDPHHTGRLFGAFQRLHGASEFPGSGIGLATVQRIVRRHGGDVWAEGAVEQGATFYFTL
jgi:signal transduction histidine kinase